MPNRLSGLKLGIAKSRGERYQVRFGFEATHQAYRPDFGIPGIDGRPADIPRDRQLSEPWDDSTTDNQIADVHADVDLSHQTRLALSVTHLRAQSTSIRQSISGIVPGAPAGTYSRTIFFEPDTRRHVNSIGTSLSSVQNTGAVTHNLFVGLEYYKEDLSAPGVPVAAVDASPPINIYSPVFGLVRKPTSFSFTTTSEDLSSVATSVQDRMDVGGWSVVAGLRHLQQSFLYGVPGTHGVDERRYSPRVGVLRHLSSTQSVYAGYSTGTVPNQAASSTNQSLPSRNSSQYEVGWKSQWMNGRASSDVAVYRLTQENMLSSDLSTPNPFDQTVAGTARAVGLEASLFGQVTTRFSVMGTYALTDSSHLKNARFAGNATANVARHTTSLWALYSWKEHWRSGVGISARSRRWADQSNTIVLPGYGVVDGTLSYLWRPSSASPVEVQLAMRNILDETYYVVSHLHVDRWIMPGERRRMLITASYRFGARL